MVYGHNYLQSPGIESTRSHMVKPATWDLESEHPLMDNFYKNYPVSPAVVSSLRGVSVSTSEHPSMENFRRIYPVSDEMLQKLRMTIGQ